MNMCLRKNYPPLPASMMQEQTQMKLLTNVQISGNTVTKRISYRYIDVHCRKTSRDFPKPMKRLVLFS